MTEKAHKTLSSTMSLVQTTRWASSNMTMTCIRLLSVALLLLSVALLSYVNSSGKIGWNSRQDLKSSRSLNEQARLHSENSVGDASRGLSSLLTHENSLTNDSPCLHRERRMFEVASPFEYRDQSCHAKCDANANGAVEEATLAPFLDPLPLCPLTNEYYEHEWRSCCQGGASSLKVRWHGCPGSLSIASPQNLVEECRGENEEELTINEEVGFRFVDCACYDTMLEYHLSSSDNDVSFAGCTLMTTQVIPSDEDYTQHDICVVAVTQSDGNNQTASSSTTALTVDLSQPLPDVIGIVLSRTLVPLEGDSTESSPTVPSRLTTYIDTTCSGNPYANPVFPGYGKFPNSCPKMAFIDLQQAGMPLLPNRIHHYRGTPPPHMFWFEFVDGTSAGFWPSKDKNHAVFSFDPTFAVCECRECGNFGSSAPSREPPTTPEPPTHEPDTSSAMPSSRNDATESPSAFVQGDPTAKQSNEPSNSPQGPSTNFPSLVPTTAVPQTPQPSAFVATAAPVNVEYTTAPRATTTQQPQNALPSPSSAPISVTATPTVPPNLEPTTEGGTMEPTVQPSPKKTFVPIGPTLDPSMAPSEGESKAPTRRPNPVDSSSSPTFETNIDGCLSTTHCGDFAFHNCRKRTGVGAESICLYEVPVGRVVRTLKDLRDGEATFFVQTIVELYESGQLSKDWVVSEMKRNQMLLSDLESQNSDY
jgi:hypothetical protein